MSPVEMTALPSKQFSDPVHGFISVPEGLILGLIQTPEVQRLRRIRQLGVGYLVFPGAEHTRFGHALGAMALMGDVLLSLSQKGTTITSDEFIAAQAAALLHDVGHAPFSHTLESELIEDFHHEKMSRAMMVKLNEALGGRLALALQIFDDTCSRPFFHQLIASQLDMDRLDYLRRDAFYTGVSEGIVGVQRIIKTMRIHPVEGGPGSELVIESKGAYAVESFIISRRLMFWQVYLHKAVLSGDHLLKGIFRRIRARLASADDVEISPALAFFLKHRITVDELEDPNVLDHYTRLDDADVIYTIKRLAQSNDPVLADLCRRFLNRDFFRVVILDDLPGDEQSTLWRDQIAGWIAANFAVSGAEARSLLPYYLLIGQSRHAAYEKHGAQSIRIVRRDGRVSDFADIPEAAAVSALSHVVTKPYVCYPKEVSLSLPQH